MESKKIDVLKGNNIKNVSNKKKNNLKYNVRYKLCYKTVSEISYNDEL